MNRKNYRKEDYMYGVNIHRMQKIFVSRSLRNPDYLASQMHELRRLAAFQCLTEKEVYEVYGEIASIAW